MSTVPSIVEQPPVAEDPTARGRAYRHWLVPACYLLGALIVTGRLWVDPAGRMQVGDARDVDLFAWFLRYSATAISHGRLPALFTTALNAPRGVNLMWNTAFNLGGGPLTVGGFRLSGSFLPYHWLQGLPGMAQVLPGRFCILGAGAAGAVLAFSLDRARQAAWQRDNWRRGVPATIAVLAVLPLIPLPYQAGRVRPVPAGWHATFATLRLAPDAPVLVVPVSMAANTEAMRWQASTGEPGSMDAGYFSGPGPRGAPVFSLGPPQSVANYLNYLSSGRGRVPRPSAAQFRAALSYWRPAAIVAVTSETSRLGRFLTGLLGRPAFRFGRVVAWRR